MRMRKENVDERKKNEEKIAHSLSLLSLCSYTDDGEYEYEWDGRFSSRGRAGCDVRRSACALFLGEKKKRKFREDEKWCLDFSFVLL